MKTMTLEIPKNSCLKKQTNQNQPTNQLKKRDNKKPTKKHNQKIPIKISNQVS